MNIDIANNSQIDAHYLEQAIRNRFCEPAWAFFPQVWNGTGALASRMADAIAMSLYPSRGLDLLGFEIKVYRNDWIKELKDPDKAETIAKYCDYWWIVAPKGIVVPDEVPTNWGLMIPFGKSLKVVKQAKKLKARNIDKAFLASILRRANEVLVPEAKLRASYKMGFAEGEKHKQFDVDAARQELARNEDKIKKFAEASGIDISACWDGGQLGEAVRMVRNGEHLRVKQELERLLTDAEQIVAGIKSRLQKNDG